MGKGLFITVEGPDGSGKSTQIAYIKKYFEEKGIDAVFTREPGGTAIGEQIRSVILNKENIEMDPVTEAMLYASARRQIVQEVIKPALDAGKVVVCDRFIDSSVAYQGYGRGLGSLVWDINRPAVGEYMPNMTLLFKMDPEKGIQRIEEKRSAESEMDRLELEELSFHERVLRGYLEIEKQYPYRVRGIDASQSIEAVSMAVKKELDAVLLYLGNTKEAIEENIAMEKQKDKRYVIRIYGEDYSFSNYDESIYLVPESEVKKEDILVEKAADTKEGILMLWEELLEKYEGYTYCVKDVTTDKFFVDGIFDSCDIEALEENIPEDFLDEIKIRALNEDDYEEVCELDELSGNGVADMLDEVDDEFTIEEMENCGYAWGIFIKDELVGYCTLGGADDFEMGYSEYPQWTNDSLLLSDVFVKEEYRGNGLALRLVKEAIERNNPENEAVFLTLLDDELGYLYEQAGFRFIEEGNMVREGLEKEPALLQNYDIDQPLNMKIENASRVKEENNAVKETQKKETVGR